MEPIVILKANPIELVTSPSGEGFNIHVNSEIYTPENEPFSWKISLLCLLEIHTRDEFDECINIDISDLQMHSDVIPAKTITLSSEVENNLPLKLWKIELKVSAQVMTYCRIAYIEVSTKRTRKKRAATIVQAAAGDNS